MNRKKKKKKKKKTEKKTQIGIFFLIFYLQYKHQAAFGFGLIRFALEYKKTPARATAVPACSESKSIEMHVKILSVNYHISIYLLAIKEFNYQGS
jgi:hypothetical protein